MSERLMPRYFFTIHGRAKIEDDRAGTYLPDVGAAFSYAEYTIRELRKKSGYNDPALMMMKPGRRFCPCRFSLANKISGSTRVAFFFYQH